MSDIKKRQHYVWRKYLRAWTTDESIWTYFIKLGKIERPGLMGVAQEKYFYKVSDFTEEEEIFLKNLIVSLSPSEDLKSFNLDFFSMFTITNRLKKQLSLAGNAFVSKELIAEEIRKLEINLIEDAHCKMEDLGFKLVEYRSVEDLKTILDDDYIFEAIMFLCIQYFRTRNMKEAVLKNFADKKHKTLMENSWNILCYVLGTTLAKSISLDPNLKFIFYENTTGRHFITGDQPVFNVLNDKLNDKGQVYQLELYYPLSPSHAILLHFREAQTDQFERRVAGLEEIEYFNKRAFENSEFYLFADSKEQLELFKAA